MGSAAVLWAADAPVQPVTVCEIMADAAAYNGKTVALIGRYSFRKNGRWVSEDGCEHKLTTGDHTWPSVVWLAIDDKSASHAPLVLEIDGISAGQKMKRMRLHTALQEFRFGSSEYDRWVVIYGRIETRPQLTVVAAPDGFKLNGFGLQNAAPVKLLIPGDGAIVFLRDE